MVAVASRFRFSNLDKPCKSLHTAIVDARDEPAQFLEQMPADHIGGLDLRLDLRSIGGNYPGFEESATAIPTLLSIEITGRLL